VKHGFSLLALGNCVECGIIPKCLVVGAHPFTMKCHPACRMVRICILVSSTLFAG
jgi:hypothetical protein